MEIVIIGGIAAGMSAAAKAARTNPQARVTVIERENYISFGACGLPYYLGGQFDDSKEMFARTPEQMQAKGIRLYLQHNVDQVDFKQKKVLLTDLKTGTQAQMAYDRLMIATGAQPIIPPIDGIKADNVYTITRLKAVHKLKQQLTELQNIVIIGGGFIGLETADQLAAQGKKVQIIEAKDQVMNNSYDPDFSQRLQGAITAKGVSVQLEEQVTRLVQSHDRVTAVITNKDEYPADAVIVAVGFKPQTSFLGPELERQANGAIMIDNYGRTSQPDVFAAGDCVAVPHRLLGHAYLPLATTANKVGRIVGQNIVLNQSQWQKYVGALGSSSIKVGDYEAASTGLTSAQAQQMELPYKTTCIQTVNHSNYYPHQEKITIKLVYDAQSFVLYGAQLFGKNETVLRSLALTTAIEAKMTTKELGFTDYAYAPPFASTWEALNVAANTAK